MYGLSDSSWDDEYFEMKDIANEELRLIKELLPEIKNTDLLVKTAIAIADFQTRIIQASSE